MKFPRASPGKPGTTLAAMLFSIGIRRESCDCRRHAETMDEWGPRECRVRLPEIVGWMRDESRKRGLAFSDLAAAALVRWAIRRSDTTP
jgi:hypothetical protein